MFVADLAAAIHTLFLWGPLLASGSAFGPRICEPAWLKPMESEGIGWEGKPSLFMLIIVRRGNRHVGRHCRRVTSVKPLFEVSLMLQPRLCHCPKYRLSLDMRSKGTARRTRGPRKDSEP